MAVGCTDADSVCVTGLQYDWLLYPYFTTPQPNVVNSHVQLGLAASHVIGTPHE